MKRTLLSIALLLPLLALAAQDLSCREIPLWGEGPIPFNKAGVHPEEEVDSAGIRYSKISVPRLYVYTRAGHEGTGPALMYIPGGGYARVVAGDYGRGTAARYLGYGFDAVAVLFYRLPDPEIVEEQHKVPLCDAQQALALMHRNAAEWGFDAEQIAVAGGSAGGHLAASLANLQEQPLAPGVEPEELAQIFNILIYPVISFNPPYRHGGSYRYLLGGRSEEQELLDHYSMELQAGPATPPTLLVHAKDDASVSYMNSIIYMEKLEESGVECAYIELEKGGHGFGFNRKRVDRDWTVEMEAWIREQLED